jgi:hypothetical protein
MSLVVQHIARVERQLLEALAQSGVATAHEAQKRTGLMAPACATCAI